MSAEFKEAATIQLPPHMGKGFLFSTAFGSTAMNRKNGGPTLDIRKNEILLTPIAAGHLNSIENDPSAVFNAVVNSPNKRPVMMSFDGFGVVKNEQGSRIASMRIQNASEDKAVSLYLAKDPIYRTYSALNPIEI